MVMDQDPMESLPAPDMVGREFVRQYYTLLNEAPEHAHRFYNSNSYFVHGTMTKPAIGQKEIHQTIQRLNFRDCHAKISQVDSQVTLGNGVVVQVSGELSNDGLPMRRFSQTFVLGTQSPKKYYVHNDIFRYQDMLQSDEEGDASPEKEDQTDVEQQETRDYYQTVPLEQAAPPQPQVTPGLNVNAPPHQVNVNGTGGLHREEPIAAPEPPVALEPAPAPVMNGTVSIMSGEDLNRVLQSPAAAENESALARPAVGPNKLDETSPQPVTEPINNRDTYEEDAYQTQNIDSSESQKVTFANLFRESSRGGRGGPGARIVRNAPPPQSTPPAAQPPPPPQHRAEPAPEPPSGRFSENNQIFVGGLPSEANENELRQLFSQYGRVTDIRIYSNKTRDSNKNYGFVTFEDPAAVASCIKNKLVFRDTQINVEERRKQNRIQGGGGRGELGHEGGGWSVGRGQSGRGRGPPRGAPRGSYSRGSAPPPNRPPYPSKR